MITKLVVLLLWSNAALLVFSEADVEANQLDVEFGLTFASSSEKVRNDTCRNGLVDAATRTKDGTTYFFKDAYYWKYSEKNSGNVTLGLISADWEGVDGPIDAALTWNDGSTFLFKGEDYWRFVDKDALPGYPRKINDGFKGIPSNLDAAVVWNNNGVSYFFKGNQYWSYNPKTETPTDGKSAPISAWKGVPNDLDAALRWENRQTYFFKGSNYYLYDNGRQTVPSGYPVSTVKAWFDCDKHQPGSNFERELPKEVEPTSKDVLKAFSHFKTSTEKSINKLMADQIRALKIFNNLLVHLKKSDTHSEFELDSKKV